MSVYELPMEYESRTSWQENFPQSRQSKKLGAVSNAANRQYHIPLIVLAVTNLVVIFAAASVGIFLIAKAKNDIRENAKVNINSSTQQVLQELKAVEGDGGKIHLALVKLNRNFNMPNHTVSCQFFFNGNCFNPLFKKGTYSAAKKLCKNKFGKLANIYNKEHIKAMVSYIREWIPWALGASYHDFYVGMTITQNNGSVFLNDGSLLDEKLLWDDNFPDDRVNDTSLLLRVNKDPSSTDQYLWNVSPYENRYALCEFRILQHP